MMCRGCGVHQAHVLHTGQAEPGRAQPLWLLLWATGSCIRDLPLAIVPCVDAAATAAPG
jgi:hypothetical protein